MKINISVFSLLIVSGLVLLLFLLWSLSLTFTVARQNQLEAETFEQEARVQLKQLQQNQREWLREQFFTLNALAESAIARQNFQSLLLDYYQRNPSVWAANLVFFDDLGRPVSNASKPGCLQPQQMRLQDFRAPAIASCRIDDKVLLEISGPVADGVGPAALLVSMDYFEFLNVYSELTGRRLQRAVDKVDGIQFEEFSASGKRGSAITIPFDDASGIVGELHLNVVTRSFWQGFERQAIGVLLTLLGVAMFLLALLHFGLIRPILELADHMRRAAQSQQDSDVAVETEVKPGLGIMREYFNTLQKMAKRDPVTGLNTRVIFEDHLAQAIRESKRSGRKYALVMIEIDGLEEFAHQRGQYIADALLQQVAEVLARSLRESDHVARFERHLFALLLEVQQRDSLNSLVEKIYLSVVRRYHVYGRELELGACFGIAVYPDHALDADGLYQQASNALVRAEHSAWPIQLYRDADDMADTSGFTLIQALRRAIDSNQLKLVYQPVVDLDSFETVYLEALLRWKDPERHDTPIDRTVRLAEQSHLIKPLSNWIFETACRFISESDIRNLTVGINLSMIDLHDRQLPERIERFLKRYRVRPGQIVIEITEGQIMQDPDEVIEVLAHLGVMGLSLSIDDFGTGQASLTYLKELPVEKLKIDQSFVQDITRNPDDQLIVKATIELAHTLDLKVVAEGVETLAVCNLLTEMNCDHVQGYYISRPLEAEAVADWFQTAVKPDLLQKDS